MSDVRPGWYPDPQQPGWQRWFDGERWTPHVQPAPPGALPAAPYGAGPRRRTPTGVIVGVVVGGCVAALVLVGVAAAIAVPAVVRQQEKAEVAALTCDDAVEDAVALSQDDDEIPVVSIDDVTLVEDRRADFRRPSGTGDVLVLTCAGSATWEDGFTADATVELYLDAELTHLVALDWDE
ncbi:DUF2510 domain-containing protein [Cellulomonas massiliensis]|uniref:DUF2510 domain-containing protein n=1 Tax=Cellulomonas massiliensis TaxID=1465811 RepID=UPI0002DC6243|nr:DUF2510 domain-containing protein [Cellulomonas massiliensis]